MPSIDGLVKKFIAHHDSLSSVRQRTISNIVLWANLGLVVLYIAATNLWSWDFDFGPTGRLTFAVVWTISLIGLFVSSGIVATASDWIEHLPPSRPAGRRPSETPI
jgi:FtsH-binding integral membrane protein